MKRIFFLKTSTVFVILLATNVVEPLLAVENIPEITQNKVKKSSVIYAVSQKLENKGLNPDVALERASAIFAENIDTTIIKLHHLQTHPKLALNTDEMIEALAKRALFEKPVNLESYDSVTGFVQDIKGHNLTSKERDAIKEIVKLNSSFA
ncbi:hypothetical protein FJR48_10195 [Sulfurimonas lithotrophica]|uniref:Uncharacterized protein n=1 Tax=Sulfurimonas lithotrophica TaxID=2590022 RepID=A0A5P8P312_9BACT|nr:hypothetical protein [Sulfurimonas lithotrophica]QFR50074.1 hypothetical protein FJR48_10195 [Sulfurimonas lithotrophica]